MAALPFGENMADKKNTSSAKKPTLGAFLQQTPETVVYGELFEGIKFGFADLGLPIWGG